MAEFVSVPCKTVHKIPSNISFREAVLIEPTAVALHGIYKIIENTEKNSLDNLSIIIFGDGPMGLLSLYAAKTKNPNKLFLVGKSQQKLDIAKKLGCDEVINTVGCSEMEAINLIKKQIGENTIDIAIEATSSNKFVDSAINEALEVIKKEGTLILIGLHDTLSISFNQIVFKELVIKGVLSSPNTWDEAIKFVLDNKIKIADIITHEFILDDVPKAFEYVRTNSGELVKAIVNIQ